LTCSERVSEVHKLLDKAKLEGPYVFVGLSIGALVARVYASKYPSEVAGMVMVDHAFIDVGAVSSSLPATPGLDSPPVLIYKEPIVLTVEDTSDFAKLPERIQELHRWAASLKPVLATVETAEDCLFQLKSAARDSRPLGDMPLVVVSTGNQQPNYQRLQTELLSLSSRSKQFIAARSLHSVEIDQPEIVIDAIRRVVEMVRK
jgi:pimeloyl-ACP methyl ester carboxylesterase